MLKKHALKVYEGSASGVVVAHPRHNGDALRDVLWMYASGSSLPLALLDLASHRRAEPFDHPARSMDWFQLVQNLCVYVNVELFNENVAG